MNQSNLTQFLRVSFHLFFYQIIAGCCIAVILYIVTHTLDSITVDMSRSYGFGIVAVFLGTVLFSYRKQQTYTLPLKTKLLEISFSNALLNVALMFIAFMALFITHSQQSLPELIALVITTLFLASIALVGLFFIILFAMRLGLVKGALSHTRHQLSI